MVWRQIGDLRRVLPVMLGTAAIGAQGNQIGDNATHQRILITDQYWPLRPRQEPGIPAAQQKLRTPLTIGFQGCGNGLGIAACKAKRVIQRRYVLAANGIEISISFGVSMPFAARTILRAMMRASLPSGRL